VYVQIEGLFPISLLIERLYLLSPPV
jgi:hypothetical protein